MSYLEYANCQDYAEKVLGYYRLWNKGRVPKDPAEAELAVREFNKERRKFKDLYGYSIRGYIQPIVNCIGWIVES
jgi:hypothetical protein